jgi:hypothetical protein
MQFLEYLEADVGVFLGQQLLLDEGTPANRDLNTNDFLLLL